MKKELSNEMKELFMANKALYKKHFLQLNIYTQVHVMAFVKINDSEFYKEFSNYIDGCKL